MDQTAITRPAESSGRMTPKDFFLNLGIVVTLYTSVISFLTLLFEIIDRVFPDALSSGYYTYGYYSSGIRFAIASLVIMFPLCIVLSVFNNRQAIAEPEKKKLAIRRWLSYLTLFLAALAMAIDLITLINTFLGGEISARFTWKVLSVLIVSGLVFGYYLFDLKVETTVPNRMKLFGWVVSIVVLAGIVGGFVIIGSPFMQRLRLFDERRVSDLQNIQWQTINFWQKKGMLPESLSGLNDSISGYTVPNDPSTKVAYEYTRTAPAAFKLCATFDLSTEQVNAKDYMRTDERGVYYASAPAPTSAEYYPTQNTWTHVKGRTCFDRTIDTDLYPVQKPTPTKM